MNTTNYFSYPAKQKVCILYTLKCSATCSHCIVKSSPYRSEKFELGVAKEIVYQSSINGKKVLILSGGEVFLFYNEILELTRHASQCGLDVWIETNGYWASSIEVTSHRIKKLVDAGLSALFVSYDYFHMPYVPFERISNIMDCACSVNLKCEIMFTPSTNPDEDNRICDTLLARDYPFYKDELLPYGGAREMFQDESPKSFQDISCCCSMTTTFLPDGEVYACCNISSDNSRLRSTPVYLGNAESCAVSELLTRERENKFLDVISQEDTLQKLLERLSEKEILSKNADKLYTICDYCVHIASDATCLQTLAEMK